MRFLIIGASGQIGSHLTTACTDRGYAHLGTYYRWPHRDLVPLDVRDSDAISELFADYQPDVTILTAGPTCSIGAEKNPDETNEITRDGTRRIAEEVARQGGSLVLISSDELFGECETAKREDDPVVASGVLARCRIEAESAVKTILPENHLILRTSWVYGPDSRRRNSCWRWLKKLAAKQTCEVAIDREGQPTFGPDLAEVALELIRHRQTGTFHVVGPDRHTEFTMARLLAHLFGHDVDLIAGRTANELDNSPRPQRVWLDRFKLRTLLGPRAIRTTAEGLRALRNSLQTKSYQQAA